MTSVSYKHISSDGKISVVKTLSEARLLVNKFGGSFSIEYNSKASEFESNARKNHRVNGDMR